MKLLWTTRQHFQLVWGGFLVLPPFMIVVAVAITLSLISSGGMGDPEWRFVILYVLGVGAVWALRLYLNRFGWLRRWMHLD